MPKPKSVSIHGMRRTHFQQLMGYLDQREQEGWYYGQKHQFEKRHKELKQWLEGVIDNQSWHSKEKKGTEHRAAMCKKLDEELKVVIRKKLDIAVTNIKTANRNLDTKDPQYIRWLLAVSMAPVKTVIKHLEHLE